MERADSDPLVSSSSSGVTVLQYLLQNESTVPLVGGESRPTGNASSTSIGSAPSVQIYPCTHPGCKKLYLNAEHLKAHERYHNGDALRVGKQAAKEDNIVQEESKQEQHEQSDLLFLLQNGHMELLPDAHDNSDEIVEEELIEESSDDQDELRMREKSLVLQGANQIEKHFVVHEQLHSNETEFEDSIIEYDGGSDSEELHVVDANAQQDVVDDTEDDEYDDDNDGEDSFFGAPKQLTYSSKERKYACEWPHCDKTYIKVSHLRVHQRSHTGELPFACSWTGCRQRFARAETLNRHLVTHTSDRNHNCRWCEKRFHRRDHLLAHVRRHNLPNSEFQQLFPGVKVTKAVLKEEAPKPSTNPPIEEIPPTDTIPAATANSIVPDPRDPARTFRCSYESCTKSYTRQSHLKAHELLHTGTLPFHCPWENCGAAFARSYELSRHRRKHSGERKFVCHICQQAFIRSDHLSCHVKRHTFRAVRVKRCRGDVRVKLKVK
ncbi:zinc finger protein 583-like [Anopheles arabiensis]|uniref:zinc finger protein 583-like n=1 Tax=Anopheles arabiensis TaxID=7173 RepID=UPI001AACEE72|nr:zinc finger protein 583-like [Anopheles arabiensis]